MPPTPTLSLCFDLDGTIVDTAPDLIRVLNLVIAEEGLKETRDAAMRAIIGYGSRALIENAMALENHHISAGRVSELQTLFLELYAQDIAQLSRPFPGVIDVLRDLKRAGHSLSVCTNKPGWLARPLLEKLGMTPLFTRIVGSDDIARNKPHADHIFAAAGHRMANRIIMVGDGAPDSLAARAAGVPCILMAYGYSPVPFEQLGADVVLRNFRGLPNAISRLSSA